MLRAYVSARRTRARTARSLATRRSLTTVTLLRFHVPKPNKRRQRGMRLHGTVRLGAEGLAKVLGDLEARVMRAIWDLGRPVPAKQVHARIVRRHDVQLLTVITVLNKLVDKGLLARAKKDDLLHYEARWDEEEFMSHASRQVVEGVLSFGPEVVAASFIDVIAERSPEQLAELSRLIRRRMREQDKE